MSETGQEAGAETWTAAEAVSLEAAAHEEFVTASAPGAEPAAAEAASDHAATQTLAAEPTIQATEPADEPRLPRADEPVAPVEIFCNSFTTAHPEKLRAIAGVMSAYNRHIAGVDGISPDALDITDVQRLGRMIGAMIGLEPEPRARAARPAARQRVSGGQG